MAWPTRMSAQNIFKFQLSDKQEATIIFQQVLNECSIYFALLDQVTSGKNLKNQEGPKV